MKDTALLENGRGTAWYVWIGLDAAWLQVLACIVIFYLYCWFLCLIINNGLGHKHYFWARCMKWLKCIRIGVGICERRYHKTCICRNISVLVSDPSNIYLLWQLCQVVFSQYKIKKIYAKFRECAWWCLIRCSSERRPRVGISFGLLPFLYVSWEMHEEF
jgi:hypothetical protein